MLKTTFNADPAIVTDLIPPYFVPVPNQDLDFKNAICHDLSSPNLLWQTTVLLVGETGIPGENQQHSSK